MIKSLLKIIFYVIIGVFVIGFVNSHKTQVGVLVQNIKSFVLPSQPCTEPITYSLSSFDSRFNMTRSEFLTIVTKAENIWESALGKDLFQYSENGELNLNLIYDYRQQATDQLKKLGLVIDNSKTSYESLKTQYISLKSSYDQQKITLANMVANFDAKKEAYEKEVDYWNKKGGAPPSKYDELERQKNDLNAEVDRINQFQNSLNNQVETLNNMVNVLNNQAKQLNLSVANFNTIGSSAGKEFDEGEYVHDEVGTRINIYQFESLDKLLRVLAHELGHALGLDHVQNPKAIMYYLNEGSNETLSADDLVELKKICRVK